nr:hypothetical protein [Tanacetum cinerariifolium]
MLSVLRGSGMHSLYSWSCKRMHKSGYVWNDLAENGVIYPSQGEEYVLKASQLVHQPDKQHMQVGDVQMHVPKCKPMTSKRHTEFKDEELESMGFKGKPANHDPPNTSGRKSSCSSTSSNLHKGVLCKSATTQKVVADEDEICCMSENPQFGNL